MFMEKSRKFNKSKEWLYKEYVINNKSRQELAKECNLSEAGIKSLLGKYNIRKPQKEISIAILTQLLAKGKTVKEICSMLHYSSHAIYDRMKKYNLTINYIPDYKQYNGANDETICTLYDKGYSTTEIGNQLGMSNTSVRNHLKHCNVKTRSLSESHWIKNKKVIPKEFTSYQDMYNLYIVQNLSKKDLGKRFNCTPDAINQVLLHLHIPIRNNAESKVGINIGEKHPNWKGGVTPLALRLREFFNVNLSPKVLKRDNYTCQNCGQVGGNLHVHHKKHFADILKRICKEHPDLDPVENINELYDIAVRDKEFLDLDNLITYCKNCHQNIHKHNVGGL